MIGKLLSNSRKMREVALLPTKLKKQKNHIPFHFRSSGFQKRWICTSPICNRSHLPTEGSPFLKLPNMQNVNKGNQPKFGQDENKDFSLFLNRTEKDLRSLCSTKNLDAASTLLSNLMPSLLAHGTSNLPPRDISLLTLGFLHVVEACVGCEDRARAYRHVDQAFQLNLLLTATAYDNTLQILSEGEDWENCSNLLAWLKAHQLRPGSHAVMEHLVRVGQGYNHDGMWECLKFLDTETVFGAYKIFIESTTLENLQCVKGVGEMDYGNLCFIVEELEHYLKAKGIKFPDLEQEYDEHIEEFFDLTEQNLIQGGLEKIEEWEEGEEEQEGDHEESIEVWEDEDRDTQEDIQNVLEKMRLEEHLDIEIHAEKGVDPEDLMIRIDDADPLPVGDDLTSQLSKLYPLSKTYFNDFPFEFPSKVK